MGDLTVVDSFSGGQPDDINFDHIERQSLAGAAADRLRRLILLGQLPPGGVVRERELAEQLGISRTPIREAVRMLEVEGLIDYSRSRRPSVANPTFEDIDKAMLVLTTLEALAGEQACLNARDAEMCRVGELHERMVVLSKDSDPLKFFETDMLFHRAIVRSAHNKVLEEATSNVNARLWRARFLSSRLKKARQRTIAQHQEIFDCLQARDASGTARAVRRHLETTVNNVRASLREEQENNSDATEDADNSPTRQ